MRRASASGFESLLLTVDGGRLLGCVTCANGFPIPPALTVSTVLDAATHPASWFNLLTTEPLEFATLPSWHGTVADMLDMLDALFDPSMTIDDLEWVRGCWDGPLVIKGIQPVDERPPRGRRHRAVEPRRTAARPRAGAPAAAAGGRPRPL